MALGWVGGILEAKKIAGMAEAHYAQIAPHLYCGPVEGAANVQLSACSPNFLILESIQDWGGFHAEILKKKVRWEEGYVIPSPAAGSAVVGGENGILAGLAPGGSWIDMSTNDRHEILRLAGLAADKGIACLEAPVTGGVHKAASGEITVLVGGERDAYEAHL